MVQVDPPLALGMQEREIFRRDSTREYQFQRVPWSGEHGLQCIAELAVSEGQGFDVDDILEVVEEHEHRLVLELREECPHFLAGGDARIALEVSELLSGWDRKESCQIRI